ncbi:unnamed protein product [Closterium sp. Yama58-4]|nr:unnamed protein product [Closterium sp. Yama58-4]
MTTVADFHSTRYTSWCPERKDIEQWASAVAEGGAPRDCRFQPLTLLPEDHENGEACNEYDYAACAEEDLDAYLESLPKSNRWTELEASCAWLDQANIRIEELDLTHGLPEHLVLNQPRVQHAPDTHHPRATAGASATASFPLPPAVPSPAAAAAAAAGAATTSGAATEGDFHHKLSSHSSFSGVSASTPRHKHHPSLRSLSSSLLNHLGFTQRPHSSPRSSPSPSVSASTSSSPMKSRQTPRRPSKEFVPRPNPQQQMHHSQHPSAPLPIPHHHASSSPGVPQGPFHQSSSYSSSPGVPSDPSHHSSSSPGMALSQLHQSSSSPKLPLAPIHHASSTPGFDFPQAPFHHSSSSPGLLVHPSGVPLTNFTEPEHGGVQYQPGVLYTHINGADMGGSSGIYSAKFVDAEEGITGVEIIGAGNIMNGGNNTGGGNIMTASNGGYSSRNPNFGGSARFIAPKMAMHEQQQQHPRQHLPRQHQAFATPGRDIGTRSKGRGRRIKVWMGNAPRANVGVNA